MRSGLLAHAKKLPFLGPVFEERDWLRRQVDAVKPYLAWVPPGHYYSPIPSLEEIQAAEPRLFGDAPAEIPGIDLRAEDQLRLVSSLARYHADQPFAAEPSPPLRYHLRNEWFSYSDGLFLHCLMRHLKPTRIIEIGSGFSSAVMLDTSERFLDGSVQLTFIEPHPERLYSLLTPHDRARAQIVEKRLQDVDFSIFGELRAGDIVFVDSSHITKIDSDVNHIFFQILPALERDVFIHIHDIFYPFEYPRSWVLDNGWFWNEAYLARAFLQYNTAFRIELFSSYLERFHRRALEEHMPLTLESPGQSLWLRKLAPPARSTTGATAQGPVERAD